MFVYWNYPQESLTNTHMIYVWYTYQWIGSSFLWEIACYLLNASPLSKPNVDLKRWVNSLASEIFGINFRSLTSEHMLQIMFMGTSWELALGECYRTPPMISQVQFRWWLGATSHYTSQCWPRSLSPSGFTSPQWVKFIKFNPPGVMSQQGINKTRMCCQ